jgi:hypothetical protein
VRPSDLTESWRQVLDMVAAPSVFISYAWEDDAHRAWVHSFASMLREDGINVRIDYWYMRPGDEITHFMETAVRESDFVLVVCTPRYKASSDARTGGVGYENQVLTGELFVLGNTQKVIPLLRRGEWPEAAPSWALGRWYLDMRAPDIERPTYTLLLRTLFGQFAGGNVLAASPNSAPTTPLQVGGPEHRPVLIAHFLDHYVLELSGYGYRGLALARCVAAEANLAFRMALLAGEQVLVPAVSYFQSPLCRRIVTQYRGMFDLGCIKLVADAYDWTEFQEYRLREYRRGSQQYDIYNGIGQMRGPLPPLAGSDRNTTSALHEQWTRFITAPSDATLDANDIARLLGSPNVPASDVRAEDVIEILGPSAFVAETIYPLMFEQQDATLLGRLSALVCSMFFRVMSEDHHATFVEDLAYIRSMKPERGSTVLSYRHFLRRLKLDPDLFREVCYCAPIDLLRLHFDPRVAAVAAESFRQVSA